MLALAATLSLLATLPARATPPAAATAAQAVDAALAVPGARAEVVEVRATAGASCPMARVEALRPVTGSGEVPLRFTGTGDDGRACQGFGWARVHVTAAGLVAARTVRAGEPLADAVAPGEIELRPGRPPPLGALPPGARAARTLAAGAPVLGDDVRAGPGPGEPITVVVRIGGGLEITQDGRAIPCTRGHACAVLPGGRRVEGRFEDGHLLLESP
jgi:hypothetical protein